MKTLDRYISRSFLTVFVGSLVAVSFLFTVISILDSLNYMMGKEGVTLWSIVRFYVLQLPQTIYMGSPVAALLSTMIVLGGMNQQNELMAMRAAGMSLARITAPILVLTLLIGAVLFVIGNTLVPVGNRYFYSARQEIKADDDSDPESRIWYVSEKRGRPPRVLRIESVARDTGELRGVTMFVTGDGFNLVRQVEADTASYNETGAWTAHDAEITDFMKKGPPVPTKLDTTELDIPDTPSELLAIQRMPEEMTLSELRSQMDRIQKYGLPKTRYLVEVHSRFAIPLAALILVMVGAPLAIRPVRSGGLALSIVGAVVIGFGYFVVIALFISMGKGGMVPAWTGAWTANILFGAAGLLLFSTMRK